MSISTILTDISIVLGFVSLIYFISEKFNINYLIGFILSGVFLGSEFLNIIPKTIGEVLSELGIVFILFSIGLHINFKELIGMRKYVLNLGVLQVGISALLLSLITGVILTFFEYKFNIALIVILSLTFALSSSAIIMEKILNKNLVGTELGNAKIGILLFQDLLAPLIIVFIPLLTSKEGLTLLSFNKELASVIGYLTLTIVGIYLFSIISSSIIKTIHSSAKSGDETVLWILIAMISGGISHFFGMSYGIGAFIGGVIFGQSAYKEEALTKIEGLKDIFMAMFFIYIGTLIEIDSIVKYWYIIVISAIVIKLVKVLGTYFACRSLKICSRNSWVIGLNLSQVSEFSLVIIGILAAYNLINNDLFQVFNAIIILTMILTIIFIEKYDIIAKKLHIDNCETK